MFIEGFLTLFTSFRMNVIEQPYNHSYIAE